MSGSIDDVVIGGTYYLKTYQMLVTEHKYEDGDIITPSGKIPGDFHYMFWLPADSRKVILRSIEAEKNLIKVRCCTPDPTYPCSYGVVVPVEALVGF